MSTLKQEIEKTVNWFIETDMNMNGKISDDTKKAAKMQLGMEFSEVGQHNSGDTVYKSVTISQGKMKWGIVQAVGKFNYVSVSKKHANPFGGVIGKEFESFDAAQANYKMPELKTAILMAETILNKTANV